MYISPFDMLDGRKGLCVCVEKEGRKEGYMNLWLYFALSAYALVT